ncbi:MAG: Nif3-like dinuclear metal center hexameric protein [Bacteroidetes bacterium]|nr:MAG: Nif3-like dinuclear metal center hexameric protein [Bacteroidota bacterium]
MIKIKDIITLLEDTAPLSYQESYDNSGLLVGDANREVSNILVSLDCTEMVVDEAIKKGCNLIVAHHPIIFKGLKKITGSNYIERTIISAIKNDIAIYACHTNLDNISGGVNFKIAEKLGLVDVKILAPKSEVLKKITVFIPKEHTEKVCDAMFKAGSGEIGNYKNCSFLVEGTGSFMPLANSNPHIGQINKTEKVVENRVECVFPAYLENKIVSEMKLAHPYEEVAHYISVLENKNSEIGSGAVGVFKKQISILDFFTTILKPKFGLHIIKHTENPELNKLKSELKIAVCGGSGVFLLPNAIRADADIFITSDIKYHEFFDAENKIVLADIGHFESEQFTKEIFYAIITKKFTNIAVLLSETNTNPVKYL